MSEERGQERIEKRERGSMRGRREREGEREEGDE